MPQPKDPFSIYKAGQTRMVHGVDYPGWAAQGWTLEPEAPELPPEPEPVRVNNDPQFNQLSPYEQRKQQLESLLKESQGWRHIEKIAKELGITQKPAGGWDEALPLILEKEGLEP